MTQRIINIGARPNDSLGEPIRTAFDKTNQNFSEIYTALGTAVPGTGYTKAQVDTITAGLQAQINALTPVLAAPVNTAVPTISGATTQGQTLTGTAGTFTGNPTPTIANLWQRDVAGNNVWTTITGATSATYVLVAADAGNRIRKGSTATNSQGSASAYSAATAIVAAPGTASAGQSLGLTLILTKAA